MMLESNRSQECFTDPALNVLKRARVAALQHSGNGVIHAQHLLAALFEESESVAVRVLQMIGVDLQELQDTISRSECMDDCKTLTGKAILFTSHTQWVIEYACKSAWQWQCNQVGTIHLLLGFLRETGGATSDILYSAHVYIDDVKKQVDALIEEEGWSVISEQPTGIVLSNPVEEALKNALQDPNG